MRAGLKSAFWGFAIGLMLGCAHLKPNALYVDKVNPQDTVFFISSEIYHDYLTSEAWVSQSTACIALEAIPEAAFKGEVGLHLKWNRTLEGCPWLGLGFGWDNWTGKDLSAIKNEAAIEFYVRMLSGTRANLPWAIGLEDFTGAQAWLGMSANAIQASAISEEWTRIELPLSEFNWDEQDADVSNIKQILFQFEADGELYMDEVRIVPYHGGFRKRVQLLTLSSSDFVVDGQPGDAIWNTPAYVFGSNEVHVALVEGSLCLAAYIQDPNPFENSHTGKDIFNGDAIEIAFSTDSEAPQKRTNYLRSDQHLGFGVGKEIIAWNWRRECPLEKAQVAALPAPQGYVFEAKISLEELGTLSLKEGHLYGLEMAVDHGAGGVRNRQERWNDPANEAFFENPSLWGEMLVIPPAKEGSATLNRTP